MDAPGDSANALNLTPEERRVFGQLFQQADKENIGVITGEVAVKFFENTRLDPLILGEIWQIADTENRGLLTPAGFGKVLRLIGHYQAGRNPTPELALRPGPLPKFEFGAPGSDIQSPPGPPPPTIHPPPSRIQPQVSGTGIRVPPLTPDKINQYTALFEKSGGAPTGYLDGQQARSVFERARLSVEILSQIWELADVEKRGVLNLTEFIIAMHLLASLKSRAMTALPSILPAGLYEAASRRGPARPLPGQGTGGPSPVPRHMTGTRRAASPLGGSAYQVPQQLTSQVTGGGWVISPQDKQRFDSIFEGITKRNKAFVTGEEAVPFFTNSKLSEEVLAQIWDLADINKEGHLNAEEFAVAMYLIREQRGNPAGAAPLPATLPPNLIPPSFRNQIRPPPIPTAPDFNAAAPPSMSKSAADDLFGLDALASPVMPPSAPTQIASGTGGSSSQFDAPSDPFGNARPATALSPMNTGSPPSNFKPFVPSSSFGQSLGYQATGNSTVSAPPNRSTPPQQASAMDDLLGDNDPVVSAKLTNETSELANLSNQISTLTTQTQAVQAERSATQSEVLRSSSQKRQFEERLATLRSLYEKEAKDVRGLQESLKASRDEIQKLQKELALLDGMYQDLQNQRQLVAAQLQSDQQENANLKEQMRAVNAEIAQLKPQLEKLRLEARQQKGLVAINKKQLSTNEAEREKVKSEVDELTKSDQGNARTIAEASSRVQSPEPAGTTSPSNNPFFRRQRSVDTSASQSYSQGSSQSFDNIFGPSIVAPEKPEKIPSEASEGPRPPRSAGEERSISYNEEHAQSVPPSPPESRQINSSFLPFSHLQRADSLSSSRKVSTPASRLGGDSASGVDTPTSVASGLGTVTASRETPRGVSPSFDRQITASPAASEALPPVNGSIPGAFPGDTPTPGVAPPTDEHSLSAAADMFPALDADDRTPTATKNDFDAAFAGFRAGSSTPQEGQNTGGTSASAPKEFDSEFPPIAELEDDDSDSASEGGGFEDNFTSPSPVQEREATSNLDAIAVQATGDPPAADAQAPPPSYERAQGNVPPPSDVHNFDGLLPSREHPTAGTKSIDDIFGAPAASAYQSPFGQPPSGGSGGGPSATITQVPQPPQKGPQPPAKVPFDDFDVDFDGLEDAQEGEADDFVDIHTIENSNRDEFNPTFDSPPTSRNGHHVAQDSSGFGGHESSFDNAFAEFGNSQHSNATRPITTAAPAQAQDSHDWDAIFSGFDKAPIETAALSPSTADGNGLRNGIETLTSPISGSSERPQLGRALTEGGEHDDPILKNLTTMGYARKDALAALEKYDYNLERAANYLAGES